MFNHSYQLIGRDDVLNQLKAFTSSVIRIALLSGRGGLGKSKILYEFSRLFDPVKHSWRLLVLKGNVKLKSDNLSQLPTQRTIIIVDDAHRSVAVLDEWVDSGDNRKKRSGGASSR